MSAYKKFCLGFASVAYVFLPFCFLALCVLLLLAMTTHKVRLNAIRQGVGFAMKFVGCAEKIVQG